MSLPRIDLKAIPFPSDSVSMGDLRRLFPRLFDLSEHAAAAFFDPRDCGDEPDRMRDEHEALGSMLWLERVVAASAYAPPYNAPAGAVERSEDAAELAGYYVQFGLARGEHEARELIRGIIRAAEEQARQHQGGGPGV